MEVFNILYNTKENNILQFVRKCMEVSLLLAVGTSAHWDDGV